MSPEAGDFAAVAVAGEEEGLAARVAGSKRRSEAGCLILAEEVFGDYGITAFGTFAAAAMAGAALCFVLDSEPSSGQSPGGTAVLAPAAAGARTEPGPGFRGMARSG